MKEIKIEVVEDGIAPVFKHQHDACCDAYARLAADEIEIPPHSRCRVNLGFKVELPENYEMQVRPRSGKSFEGLDVALGTVDPTFCNEVNVLVINNNEHEFKIMNKERICQLAIREFEDIHFVFGTVTGDKDRTGWGSSGKF